MDCYRYNFFFLKTKSGYDYYKNGCQKANQLVRFSHIYLNFWRTYIISYSSVNHAPTPAGYQRILVLPYQCIFVAEKEREREKEREQVKKSSMIPLFQSFIHILLPHILSATTFEINLTNYFLIYISLCFSLLYFLVLDNKIEGWRISAQLLTHRVWIMQLR